MRSEKCRLVVVVGLLFILSLFLAGCGNNKVTNEPTPPPAAEKPTPPPAMSEKAPSENTPKEDPWQKVLDAAAVEGRLVVNMPNGGYVRDVIKAFEEAYPSIKVEFTQLLGNEFTPRINAERNAGQYLWDVYVGGSGTLHTSLIPSGSITDFPRDLPESTPSPQLDGLWRGGFDHGFSDDGRKYSYAISGYLVNSVLINRDVISESELNKPEDLLDPKWEGKMTWQSPNRAGLGSLSAAQILNAHGEEYLRKLLNQKIVVTDNRMQQAGWLARGAYPIGIGVSRAELDEIMKETNANIQPFMPGAEFKLETFGATSVALIKDAPNPNAARVFINWLLSKEGGEVHAEKSEFNSRRTDVPTVDQASEIQVDEKLIALSREEHVGLTQKAIAIVKEEIE